MIARLNYTGRRKILRSQISLTMDMRGHLPRVNVRVNLDEQQPSDSMCFLEAYRRGRAQRFCLGGPDDWIKDQSVELRPSLGELVLFRLKVVAGGGGEPRLLAHADRIQPVLILASGRRMPLLPVRPGDLGDELWRIHYEDDRPILLVNRDTPNIMDLVGGNPGFRAAVFPAALREILRHFLGEETLDEDDPDGDTWAHRWIGFSAQLSGRALPAIEGSNDLRRLSAEPWIDQACDALARRLSARTAFVLWGLP